MIGLLSLPQKIAGGLMAVALLLAGIYGLREHIAAGRWQRQADSTAEKLKTEEAKHAATRMSVEVCASALVDQSTANRKLAADGLARGKAAADELKAAQEAGERSDRIAATSEASAATVRPGAAACAPSDTFWTQTRKEL